MGANDQNRNAAGVSPRRLFFYNAGFLRQPRLRRILALAGHDLHLGLPGPGDGVAVWGRSRHAARGEAIAARRGVPLFRLEDAFLRSIRPGRMGDAPLGLLIDPQGVHFDASAPSALERLLTNHPLDDSNILQRARDGIGRLQAIHLSKYNIHDPTLPAPTAGYVLVVDQTRGDASIRHSGAHAGTFREMLVIAQEENPGARVIIKTHPETAQGLRPGHYGPEDATGRVTLLADPVSPWALLDGAIAVYTVSSQLGFEAILAGHRPRVFGQPFYAGWGLSQDENPVPRRCRRLTRAQLFAAAMILAPTWYDPCRDRLCNFEEAVDQLEAEARAYREDRHGHVALGMRLWKRGRLQAVFGREKPLIFQDSVERALARAQADGRGLLVWAGKEPVVLKAPTIPSPVPIPPVPIRRVEDGFLRSRGLGANLIPPLSLVTDDLGIYYDPGRDSRLERLIAAAPPPGGVLRATRLVERLVALGLSKYNIGSTALPDLPELPDLPQRPGPANRPGLPDRPGGFQRRGGRRILVPGQVEDDASIRLGAGAVRSNLGLLQATRAANPEAVLIYKPHPDVEAGLRPGAVPPAALRGLADAIAPDADPIVLLAQVDEVWTMTSLLGFEALLRGKPVTCLGAPFYAGWGLTRDLGPIPQRRRLTPDGQPLPRRDLAALAHAALIAYPRYFDPVSRRPCPPEVVLDRLAHGPLPQPGPFNRALAKLQGRLASHARLWRR